jgi:hypothetical protein
MGAFDDLIPAQTAAPSAEPQTAAPATPKGAFDDLVPKQPIGFWSEIGKAVNPFEIAKEVGRTASESLEGIENLPRSIARGDNVKAIRENPFNPLAGMGPTAQAAAGVVGIPMSPIVGTARNVIGHTMTALEGLAAKAFPDRPNRPTADQAYDRWRGDVDTAMMAARPIGSPVKAVPGLRPPPPETALGGPRYPNIPGNPPTIAHDPVFELPQGKPSYEWQPPPAAPPPVPKTGTEMAEAAARLGMTLPNALATENRFNQGAGQFLSKIPIVGTRLARSAEAVPEALGGAREQLAGELGTSTAPNVGGRIRETLEGAAGAETGAAKAQAAQTDAQAQAAYERANAERQAAIDTREAQSHAQVRQAVGDTEPLPMGETVISEVRANEQAARAAKEAAYTEAGAKQGTIGLDAVGTARGEVLHDLNDPRGGRGVVVVNDQTPAAANMLRELEQFSAGKIPNYAEPPRPPAAPGDAPQPVGVTLQGVEHQRQRLNAIAGNAATDGDARAARRIIGAFDEWQHRAMQRSFSGDPDAFPAFQRARAANRDWRERFGYNADDPHGKTLNKIATGEAVGPNDIANILTNVKSDKAPALLDRITAATGNHPDVTQAIRGGVYRSVRDDPAKIEELLRGRGQNLATRLFSPEQQQIMTAHAQELRNMARARELVPQAEKLTKPVPTKVEAGPMQKLSDAVVGGKSGEEALFNAIEGYAKSRNAPDINRLAAVMRNLPEDLKKNFGGAFIRRLGNSAKTGEFSEAVFAKEWENITPQAKMILFGAEGPYRAHLDDIAKVSRHVEQMRAKFGNPSGTGQFVAMIEGTKKAVTVAAAMAAGHFVSPALTVIGGLGSYGYARLLARPAGAASVARFSRAIERANEAPSIGTLTAARLAYTNVANTARSLGIQKVNERKR